MLHGEAIVIGMMAEAWLSYQKKGLTKTELNYIVSVLKTKFNPQAIHTSYTNAIVDLSLNDKKNSKNEIRCVLLNGVGDYKIDVAITPVQIKKALEYYNSVVE